MPDLGGGFPQGRGLPSAPGVRVALGTGFAGRIAASRQPVILTEVNEHTVSNPLLIKREIWSLLGVPLFAGGKVIGMLHVGSLSERRFGQEDVDLLQLAADRAARCPESGEFLVSSAGHLPPVLSAPGDQPASLPVRPDPPIGTADDPPRHSSLIVVPPGGLLCCYTHGLVERRDQPLDDGIGLLAATLDGWVAARTSRATRGGSLEDRARIEGHADPRDQAIFHVAPVDGGQRPGGAGAQIEPGDDVRPVGPALDHLDLPRQGEHACQPPERLLGPAGAAQRPRRSRRPGEAAAAPDQCRRFPRRAGSPRGRDRAPARPSPSPAAGGPPPTEISRVRYDLRPGSPDLSAFPRARWLSAARKALSAAPSQALGYSDPRGRPELRAVLAAYLARTRGVRAAPDRIVVCSGFAQGLALLCQVLPGAGVTGVAVEEYGRQDPVRALAGSGLTPVMLGVDEGGAVLDRATGAEAMLLTPAHQFPLGSVLSPQRRADAARWAARTGGLIVEDDYDGEFRYDRQPVGVLQALAPGHVVYAGTASKTMAPGLRLGWLVLPARLTDAVAAKARADAHTSGLEQLTLAEFIGSGAYDRHIRRTRLAYRHRRDRLVAALARHAPGVRVSGIAAGLHAVAELPPGQRPWAGPLAG